jgi:hypothetical protein
MEICKFCYSHNGLQQFPPKYYYEKLKQGLTVVHCESCGDTYEYIKDAHDKVNEFLVIDNERINTKKF